MYVHIKVIITAGTYKIHYSMTQSQEVCSGHSHPQRVFSVKIEDQSFHTLLDWSSPVNKACLIHVCLPLLAISGPIHVCLPLLLAISGPIHWFGACAWSPGGGWGYANIWLCPWVVPLGSPWSPCSDLAGTC